MFILKELTVNERYFEKRNELYNLESETEIVPVVITAEDLGEQTISLNDIVGLEGIVDFE